MSQPAGSLVDNPVAAEEARIQQVYRSRNDGSLYSCFNPAQLFNLQQRERDIVNALREENYQELHSKTILDVGCGNGHWLREFVKWGANPGNVHGVDLLHERVAVAKRLSPASVKIDQQSAAALLFPNGAFDLVCQSMVFTSILDAELKRRVAAEMLRVLKSDGMILWYDYYVNNPWNPDVRGVKRKEIYQLFPGCRIRLKRITLAPPLARVLAPYSYLGCCLLEKLPLLCTHYLGVIRKL